jgi:hypothetical protein
MSKIVLTGAHISPRIPRDQPHLSLAENALETSMCLGSTVISIVIALRASPSPLLVESKTAECAGLLQRAQSVIEKICLSLLLHSERTLLTLIGSTKQPSRSALRRCQFQCDSFMRHKLVYRLRSTDHPLDRKSSREIAAGERTPDLMRWGSNIVRKTISLSATNPGEIQRAAENRSSR